MIIFDKIIVISWATFLLVWGFLAFNVKRDIRGGLGSVWRKYWLLRIGVAGFLIFLVIRVATGSVHYATPTKSIFSSGLYSPSLLLGWIAAALTASGIGIAIWARLYLGKNWSPSPAVKEHHELVTSGPYAYVRHPIYSGMILAALGTALSGSVFGLVVLIFGPLVFILRIHKEEKIMLELFPNEYPAYQVRTKRLIPFVW